MKRKNPPRGATFHAIASACLFSSALLCVYTSCSFDYSEGGADSPPPDMTFSNTHAVRYSDGKKTMEITAATLEIYSQEKIWAGENVAFDEYPENGGGENSASAGLMLLDEKAETYTLGRGVVFTISEDDITIHADDVRWNKAEGLLSSPVNSSVSISSGNITATGRGFSADTKGRSYLFSADVSGIMSPEESEGEADPPRDAPQGQNR